MASEYGEIIQNDKGEYARRVGENSYKRINVEVNPQGLPFEKLDNGNYRQLDLPKVQATDALEGPTGAEVLQGVGAEVAISTAAQLAGAGTGPLYPFIAFAGGVLGNLTAQEIEGRENYSIGRAIMGGLINLIPGAKAVKSAKAAAKAAGMPLSTAQAMKIGALAEGKRGAAFGAAEATAVAVIDEQRPPTPGELALFAGGGAIFGSAIGGMTQGIGPAYRKVVGKTVKEIDEMAVSGKLTVDDIAALSTGGPVTEPAKVDARKLIYKMQDSDVSHKIVDSLTGEDAAVFAGDRLSRWDKSKIAFKPSKTLGKEAADVVFYGKKNLESVENLTTRIARNVDKAIAKDPSLEVDISDFIDTNKMSKRLAGTTVAADLKIYAKEMRTFQKELLTQLDLNTFKGLNPEKQGALIEKIVDSMKSDTPQYFSREYQLFTNPKYVVNSVKRAAAHKEIAGKLITKNPKMSSKEASRLANKHIDDLISNSASSRDSHTRFRGGAVDSMLRARTNPGKAEADFLGEIVKPSERMRGTLDGLAKTVYRNQTDLLVAKSLQKAGLAGPLQAAGGTKLELAGNLDTGLFVPNEVQYAIGQSYLAKNSGPDNFLLRGAADALSTTVSLSKAVKVLLNPPSYATNAWGAATTMTAMGMNPFGKGVRKGMKLALAEFGNVEDLVSGRSEKSRTQFMGAIRDMTKYGLGAANVDVGDIRAGLDRGIFSESLDKVLTPFSKAYMVTDTAARYGVWTHNQAALSKMFPTLKGDKLKYAAARLTNDTFQNYEKLSPLLKTASKHGILPQFVAFTGEFIRNIYHQTRYAKHMAFSPDKFGSTLGITDAANISAIRTEGIKRLVALTAVTAGTEATRRAWNDNNGVGLEEEQALRDTVVPEYDQNKSLLFNKDPETGKLSYMNMSYVVPHTMMAETFNAAMSDTPLESLSQQLADQFIGEGSFVTRSALQAVDNRDEKGKKISNQTDFGGNLAERLSYFASEAFAPGASRELTKVLDSLKPDARYTTEEIAVRQAGGRFNKVDVELSAMFKVKDNVSSLRQGAADYKNLVEYRNPTPSQKQEQYVASENIRKQNFGQIVVHNNNMKTLGMDEDTRIGILKDAGVNTSDILDVLEGRYQPLDTEAKESTTDYFDREFGGLSGSDFGKKLGNLYKNEPILAERVKGEYARRQREIRADLSQRDKLVGSLGTEERAKYMLDHPRDIRKFLKAGLVNKQINMQLNSQGYSVSKLLKMGDDLNNME
jgi:hypothetical protein